MSSWLFGFRGFDPDDEGRREALCTLGNGYFATRGAAPECTADDVHYPGTYVAGCYNRLTTEVAGREVEQESVVNMPNWLLLTFRVDGGPWLDLRRLEVLDHEQELDLERGFLVRRLRFRDEQWRTTRLVQHRFAHMAAPHLAGLDTTLVAEDWSGQVTFRCGIDGRVTNSGVARYRALDSQHLTDHRTFETATGIVVLHARTSQSGIRVAEAARSQVFAGGQPSDVARSLVQQGDLITHDLTVQLERGSEVRVEKIASLRTSRDAASTEPVTEAVDEVRCAPDFDELCRSHTLAWARLHREFHCGLSTSEEAQRAVRLHLFHLLQTISPTSGDLDVGVPARGLHGEAYRGHVFWDELFVLPTLTLRRPRLARTLLMYRYRRLGRARRAASEAGLPGAMFPWQSGSNGREESQQLHLNPRSGRWLPDHTHLQRHVGIAIAHNIHHYHRATGDDEFLSEFGAEMLLEITRFFAALAHYDRSRDRYVIRGVVGPDEYHTGYPGQARPGIDNNAYTNIMTAWLCRTAAEVLRELPTERRHELVEQLNLRHGEIDRWKRIAQRMYVPFHGNGIISQFEGYDQLAELDWDGYRRRYGDIHRLDRILEAEGDDPNRYQASKQADVLMLFYLLSAEELGGLLEGLGYPMPADTIPANIEYYLQRTSHGSTLSAVVHAWVLARSHRHRALEFFDHVLAADIHDTQRGTTSEGVHLAAMAGSIDLLQRCFAGIEVRDGALRLNPLWPTELGDLELTLRYQGQPLTITVTGRTATVRTAPGPARPPITCACGIRSVLLGPGETARFSLEHRSWKDDSS
ncbi:trehalose 6-phosphate phosphatase [Saccharopolyspora kobensis]|uniref:Trehalose 6-phosphate phosphatase n=1 Tax=Saccharopolyspora kobensis TaxID=146035 RepID=A0A1H5V714_9PSEU|nr:glycosyl hydrolase family 65 protein [Saccharopolyspora kobensis]SEF83192.1 trehalose 6-phosphate phosphatase [Saccharopolyspora kobensis]SFC64316.1 trehalose 6-phosphate phosphatase [Saccharopolyspora kobensis]